MPSEVAASQSQSTKKTQSNLAKALHLASRLRTLFAIAANIQQTTRAAGATVAAGAAIVPTATITQQGAVGRFKVTAYFSGTAPAGNVTPLLSFGLHGGVLPVVVAPKQDTTTEPDFSASIIITTSGAPGSQWDATMTTTVGDQIVTLGHGIVGNAAGLIVEEILS
jgi:hypothetical protein